jgi:signal transduction histidine kinase
VNLAPTIALAAATSAILAGAMSRRLSLAPGWRDQLGFSLVAFTAAAYSLCNLATSIGLPDRVVTVTSRFQVASAVLHFWAWLRYTDAFEGRPPGTRSAWLGRAALAGAALALVPRVVFTGEVVSHAVPMFGTVYRDAVPSTFGYVLLAAVMIACLVVLLRFVRAWRAGVRYAGVHALAFGALLLFGANDALATSGHFPTPYLLDTGFVVPIVAVYWTITARFVDNARALDSVRGRLELLVGTRTRELADAQAALHQAEKLAVIGRFATAVAGEVSGPAGEARSRLAVLEAVAASETPGARDAVAAARASIEQIDALSRKLVEAGRITSAAPGGTAPLAEVVRRTVDEVRSGAAGRAEFVDAVPPGLSVRAGEEALHEVLAHVLHNAAESIPAGRRGRIEVRAERRGGTARITIADDGVGMPPEVVRQACDPFFTTKGPGAGRGLGLAVARGLVEGNGGALWIESEPGRGTRAMIELPLAR